MTTPLLLSHQQTKHRELAVVASVSGDGLRPLIDDTNVTLHPGDFSLMWVNPDKAVAETLIERMVCLYAEQANTE